MRAIYITGFMGSGKTTVGRRLGELLNLPVFDTDEHVSNLETMSISKIFASKGEKEFRKLESDMLRSLPTEDCIITTGGGIILAEENRVWMKENGHYVYLYCDPGEIVQRLAGDESRPLISGDKKKELLPLFLTRKSLYEEAEFHIDTTSKSIEVIAEEIIKSIKIA
ncbi:shikimate kinase [Peribacillus saganii]|uniref:Shikimate kinase n=1 Tax=Peribacillus saganii TaxID=2303992 RepID=A0A372LKN9_9BACI|nr:shikimate kinase [Peribacillus saganii]RFU66776.1 shikimate kinase [Peribacillus saganii]